MVDSGAIWLANVSSGMEQYGGVMLGPLWSGSVRHSSLRYGMVRYGWIWFVLQRNAMALYVSAR